MEAQPIREVASAAESGWRLSDSSFALRECDEGALVYDERSGQTSLLNPQAAQVLRILSSGARHAEYDLRLALALNDESDAQQFQDLLVSLESSGLIAPC